MEWSQDPGLGGHGRRSSGRKEGRTEAEEGMVLAPDLGQRASLAPRPQGSYKPVCAKAEAMEPQAQRVCMGGRACSQPGGGR